MNPSARAPETERQLIKAEVSIKPIGSKRLTFRIHVYDLSDSRYMGRLRKSIPKMDFVDFSQVQGREYPVVPMPTDLAVLLTRLKTEKFGGNQQKMADATGVGTSWLTRVIKRGEGPLDVLPCLRLAAATGIPASEVLTAAGRLDVLALIRQLFGTERSAFVRPEEDAILRVIMPLNERLRVEVLSYAAYLASRSQPIEASATVAAPVPDRQETKRRSR